MAKLVDVMTKKGGGKLLTRDLTGKACLITEDVTETTEIRETEDGKYLCIQVKVDGEVKDWNPTKPQLRSVVEMLGKPVNLKGKMFQVTGSIKDGYQSKTVAIELRGDYAPEQQTRIPQEEFPQPAAYPPVAKSAGVSDLAVFLGAIDAQPNHQVVGDDALDQLALLISNGDPTKANFLKGVAKSAGRITNVGGCWSVTK